MTALFRTNSPSNRPKGNQQSSNRAKFPFILMPVTDIGEDESSYDCDDCNVDSPSPQVQHPVQYHDNTIPARRNTGVPAGIRSRFPAISTSTGLIGDSPLEQIRRAARTLYPSSAVPGNNRTSNSGSRENILFSGLPLPNQQSQPPAVVLPRVRNRTTAAQRLRAPVWNPSDDPISPVTSRRVSASNSASQLIFGVGRGDTGNTGSTTVQNTPNTARQREMELQLQEKDKEILQLKQEQAKLKMTLKETAIEAQTIKAQQESLRREFATLENHFESLEEKFDNQDDIATVREILSQATTRPPPQRSIFLDSALNLTKPPPPMPNYIDFDRLISMTHELNSIAGSYQALEIGYTSVGATFKRPNPITLTLYRNGMTLDNNLFRPYVAVSTIQFIQDIYDGYFPSELQSKYPDGITIVVEDERHKTHPGGPVFPGTGRKLGEQVEFVTKFYPGQKLNPKKSEQPACSHQKSSKSPHRSPRPITYVHLPDLLSNPCLSSRPDTLTQRALYKHTRQKSLHLKLRNLQTGTTYKLKTSACATPDEILRHLEAQLGVLSPNADGSTAKYQLLNSVPFGLFSIGDTSLRRYGITSNTLFYFRPI